MEFQKSEYFQKRAHKLYPSISRGFRLLKRGFRLLKRTQSSSRGSMLLKRTQSSLFRDFCCLSISQLPRCLRQASYLHFHQSPARKSPKRLFSPIQHPPESFLTTPPEISRFLLPLDSLRPRGLRQAPYLHFHQSPARKSPEGLFSPSQRPQESFLTTPPEISRFPFGTKVIKILDLSLYLPPTRPFTVSPTLSYSPKPVLHQPRHPPESAPLVHQSPCTFYPHLTMSYNNTHQSSSLLPTITKFAFPTVHPALFSFSMAIWNSSRRELHGI